MPSIHTHAHTHTLTHIHVHAYVPHQTYNLMSERWFTHASPTLFNAGTCRPQLSSCFLVCMKEDSIEVSSVNLTRKEWGSDVFRGVRLGNLICGFTLT